MTQRELLQCIVEERGRERMGGGSERESGRERERQRETEREKRKKKEIEIARDRRKFPETSFLRRQSFRPSLLKANYKCVFFCYSI